VFLYRYALKTGVITAVLVGLTAAKAITEKRLEFFRESASGYDINAYFAALNITSGIEHSLQAILAASAAFWLRNSLAHWTSYCVSFFMMAWLCVSWALLIPLLVPPKNVVLVVGFFMAFFGLLFSGGLSPTKYKGT
jgi:ABC-type enterobactin transport system permease subunit